MFAPLFAADFVDVLKAVIPILLFVFWVVSQVFGGAKEKAEAQKRRAQQREQVKQRAGEQQRPKNEDITSEIEDFLKRAAERRENKGQPRPRPPETVQTKPPRRPPEKRRETKSEPPKREPLTQLSRETRPPAAPVERPRTRTAAPSLAPTRVDERRPIEHLHDTSVDQADEAMAAHVNQVFGHQVGSLAASLSPGADAASSTSGATAGAPVTAPLGLAAMLADRRNLQSAIILNEIFQRPEHRW